MDCLMCVFLCALEQPLPPLNSVASFHELDDDDLARYLEFYRLRTTPQEPEHGRVLLVGFALGVSYDLFIECSKRLPEEAPTASSGCM